MNDSRLLVAIPSLYNLANYGRFSVCFLSPGVSYPPVYTVLKLQAGFAVYLHSIRNFEFRPHVPISVDVFPMKSIPREISYNKTDDLNTTLTILARDQNRARQTAPKKRRSFQVNLMLSFCHNDKHETQHVGS